MKQLFLFISVLILASCSTKKDRFVNRKYHALVTKYNIVYNGKLAYRKGLDKVEENYQDDFKDLLPIEPFSFYANQKLKDGVQPLGQADFDKAEEKAVKAIQKHSMLIWKEERNSQIDEAYLLLGKSRYYTKRFGPALDAFEYIIKNYQSASLIYETVVWRAKTNLHIGNKDFGKRALKRLLTAPNLPKEVVQQAELGLVMAYEKEKDSLSLVIKHLENSLKAVKEGSVASRAAFVLGQAQRKKGDIEASDKAFDQVIGMKKGLYKFKLQAKLEKINNHITDYSPEQFIEEVDKLIFKTKNRRYLGKLLYEKALIYEENDSIDLAKEFYTKSVLKSRNNVDQKMSSYEKLGDIYYAEKDYRTSKTYYDSLIDLSKRNKLRNVVPIQRKSKNLERIVEIQERTIVYDSLLKVAYMDDDASKLFFENHIEKIKQKEKKQRKKELKELALQNKTGFDDKSKWYFYNTKIRLAGKAEFIKTWGRIAKKPTWYASSLNNRLVSSNENDSIAVVVKKGKTLDKYDVAYYTNTINKEPKFLDSISKLRDLSYYELGNAYYNQFKEVDLAIEKLESLLFFNPKDELKTGAYYRLYKIYSDVGDENNANLYKTKMQQEFPESPFTKTVFNQQIQKNKEGDDYSNQYKKIYNLYVNGAYKEARAEMNKSLQLYLESPYAAKYELLNAYIYAKEEDKDRFYELLNQIKLKYPNAVEAKKAIELLKNK